jgi:hypothetical protein
MPQDRIPFTHLRLVKDEAHEQARKHAAFLADLQYWDAQHGLRAEKYTRIDQSPTYLFPRKDW